ncbi:MAG: MOSC domain-containing protein [Beijerinckiaceae bacterium]
MTANVTSLYRYPVKGLSPEPLTHVALTADAHFPGDRLFAVENGPSGFDPAAAEHLPKIKFLMLMRNGRLAKLRSRYDDATGVLSVSQGGVVAAFGDLATAEGRGAIESFLSRFCADELRGPPKLLSGPPGFRFMDSRSGFLSIIDLASVAAIAEAAGRKAVDPLRFRANVYVKGLGAWGEFPLVGRRMRLGGAILEITKRIDRCAATDVDPSLGVRDLRMVELLERAFGHHDCGVYARVVSGGEVGPGDAFEPA